jgi:hypothetical protein
MDWKNRISGRFEKGALYGEEVGGCIRRRKEGGLKGNRIVEKHVQNNGI